MRDFAAWPSDALAWPAEGHQAIGGNDGQSPGVDLPGARAGQRPP
ncbi:hypothetical protein [Micromonospora sp. NPDC002931]